MESSVFIGLSSLENRDDGICAIHTHRGNDIIDNGLKSSIFFQANGLWIAGRRKCFSQPTYSFRDRLFAFNPLRILSPQHHPDRNIREEEKKKIAALYKSHTVIIQQIIFVPRYLK
jgi:hypothetical protein